MSASTSPHRDNLFGVCHALAETFGFDPLVLRVLLMLGLLLNAEATVLAYAAGAVALLAAALLSGRSPAPAAPDTVQASSCR